MHLQAPPRTKCGFTLIELLTVIAIIAVLAAVLFPALGRVQAGARSTECLSNLRQIGIGISLYAAENNNQLPGPIGGGVSPILVANQTNQLVYRIQPYLALPEPTATPHYAKLFHCPGLSGEALAGQANWWNVTNYVVYSNNDMPPAQRYLPDMQVTDSAGRSWPVGPWGRSNSTPATPGWRLNQLAGQVDHSKEGASLSNTPAIYETDGRYPPQGKSAWPWPVPPRGAHGTHINVLYFDWHVGQVDPWAFSPNKPE